MYRFTAAHRSLPLPSFVRVTNLENGRSLVVRVNDRGPFKPGRIIDLSWAAAKKLGYVKQGVAKVRIELVQAPHGLENTPPQAGLLFLQVEPNGQQKARETAPGPGRATGRSGARAAPQTGLAAFGFCARATGGGISPGHRLNGFCEIMPDPVKLPGSHAPARTNPE